MCVRQIRRRSMLVVSRQNVRFRNFFKKILNKKKENASDDMKNTRTN